MEELSIRIKIADRHYPMVVTPDKEALVREVAKQIQERITQQRAQGVSDTQSALAIIAFHCMMDNVAKDQHLQRFQKVVFDKITQLDTIVTPVTNP